MRQTAENPNALMASMHLRRYTEEMYRQERQAGTGTLQERASLAADRATFRSSQLTKMEHGRGDKVKKLQHDDAVHATLLTHKVATTGLCVRVPEKKDVHSLGARTTSAMPPNASVSHAPASCYRMIWSARSCAWSWR